ncbi:MAG: hypothetical protein ACFFBK_14075 [Promethearchaeota archaeon]
MTIYEINIISTTGFPYFNTMIKSIPEGVKLFLRFFDFSENIAVVQDHLDLGSKFDLTAGLISALFEFARNIDKKIELLQFKPKKEKKSLKANEEKIKRQGDVLITVQTESFLLHKSVKEKIKLIYNNYINSKIPLDSAENIYENDENKIIDILTDSKAKEKFLKHKSEIKRLANNFLTEMKDYGLWGICISSFDLSPIVSFGKKIFFRKCI